MNTRKTYRLIVESIRLETDALRGRWARYRALRRCAALELRCGKAATVDAVCADLELQEAAAACGGLKTQIDNHRQRIADLWGGISVCKDKTRVSRVRETLATLKSLGGTCLALRQCRRKLTGAQRHLGALVLNRETVDDEFSQMRANWAASLQQQADTWILIEQLGSKRAELKQRSGFDSRAVVGTAIATGIILLSLGSWIARTDRSHVGAHSSVTFGNARFNSGHLDDHRSGRQKVDDDSSLHPSALSIRHSVSPAPELSSGAIGETDNFNADAVVDSVLAPTSQQYLDGGFKNFQFGMAQKEVVNDTGPLVAAPTIPGWLTDSDKNLYRFDEAGKLRAMVRRYIGNMNGHLTAIRDLFGPAQGECVRTALRSVPGEDHLISTAEAEYVLPKVFAVAESDEEQIGYLKSERIFLSLYDREWLRSLLISEAAAIQEVLRWANANVIPLAADTNAGLEQLTGPPGTKSAYAGLGKAARYKWLPNGRHSEAIEFNDDHGQVLFVERALEDFPDGTEFQRKGGVRVCISTAAISQGTIPVLDRSTNSILTRLSSGVAQGIFPPAANNIVWTKEPDSTIKSYEWETASRWKIAIVGPRIYLLKAPKTEL